MELAYKSTYNALVTKGPFLYFPLPDIMLELATNASGTAIGAALFQVINDDIKYISFNLCILTVSEINLKCIIIYKNDIIVFLIKMQQPLVITTVHINALCQ